MIGNYDTMNNNKKYFAFISYKREDEKWAGWLQDVIERYRLPVSLKRKRPELPASCRPLFRDSTDLCGGVLADVIKRGLDNSKYLIVICSPRAASSQWVCKEVQEFIDSGRADNIIPFIIEGCPNSSDPSKECFPESLRILCGTRSEVLGINVNENGREAAAVKVIARMLGVDFDSLWQRHRKIEEQERQRVKEENNRLLAIQSKCIAMSSNQLLLEGNSAMAQYLCLQALPRKLNNADRPYVLEADCALRKAYHNKSYAVFYDIDAHSISFSKGGEYLITGGREYENKPICVINLRTFEHFAFRGISGRDAKITSDGYVYFEKMTTDGKIEGRYLLNLADGQLESQSKWRAHGKEGRRQYLSFQSISKVKYMNEENEDEVDVGSYDWYIKKGDAGEYLYNIKNNITIFYDVELCYDQVSHIKSKDGRYSVSVGEYGAIELWDSKLNKQTVYEGHEKPIRFLSFTPDSKHFVSYSSDRSLRIWSVVEEEYIILSHQFNYHGYAVNPHITNIQFSYDNRYIVATTSCNDAKGVISLWDLSTGTVKTEEHCFKDVLQPPIFFSKNSEYCLTFLNNEDILVYDLAGNKSLSIQNHSNISGRAKAISFSKNEEWLIVDCEDRVNVWSVEDWSCRSVMKHGETPNYNKYLGIYENEVIMLDDNRLYLSDIVDNTVRRVMLAETITKRETVDGETMEDIKILQDQTKRYIVALLPDGGIALYDIACKIFIDVNHPKLNVSHASFSSDSKYLAIVYSDDSVALFDVGHKKILTLDQPDSKVVNVKFSPDGKSIVIAYSNGLLRVYSLSKHNFNQVKILNKVSCGELHFSKGSTWVYCYLDKTNILWNVRNNRTIMLKSGSTLDWVFSRNGKYFILSYATGDLYCYNTISGECIVDKADSQKVLNFVNDLKISPDGDYIYISRCYVDDSLEHYLINLESNIKFDLVELYSSYLGENNSLSDAIDLVFNSDWSAFACNVSSCGESIDLFRLKNLQEIINEAYDNVHNLVLTKEERKRYYLDE